MQDKELTAMLIDSYANIQRILTTDRLDILAIITLSRFFKISNILNIFIISNMILIIICNPFKMRYEVF